jgi:hypothetical protein
MSTGVQSEHADLVIRASHDLKRSGIAGTMGHHSTGPCAERSWVKISCCRQAANCAEASPVAELLVSSMLDSSEFLASLHEFAVLLPIE